MSETYFFKKIDGRDANTLSFFRYTRPLAFVVGSTSGFFFLLFFNIQYLFVTLGIIMLLGIPYLLALEDTK